MSTLNFTPFSPIKHPWSVALARRLCTLPRASVDVQESSPHVHSLNTTLVTSLNNQSWTTACSYWPLSGPGTVCRMGSFRITCVLTDQLLMKAEYILVIFHRPSFDNHSEHSTHGQIKVFEDPRLEQFCGPTIPFPFIVLYIVSFRWRAYHRG